MQHCLLGDAGEGGASVRAAGGHAQHLPASSARQRHVPGAAAGSGSRSAGGCAQDAGEDRTGGHPQSRGKVGVVVQPLAVPPLRQLAHPGGGQQQDAGGVEGAAGVLGSTL